MNFELYDNFPNGKKQLFSDIVNDLLAKNYLCKQKKDNMEKYFFVINYRELFEEYLKIMSYELIINRELGVVQIKNTRNANSLKLRKEETLILLILRMIYHEKMETVSMTENTICDIIELHEKYASLELRKRLTKTDLVSIIRLFKRYNIIDTMGDINSSTLKLIIYPTILYAVPAKEIEEVSRTISNLSREGDF